MSKIALIGPAQMVAPLSGLGIWAFGCDTGAQAEKTLNDLKDFSLVFLTERLALDCSETVEALQDKINIVLVPDHRGSTGLFKDKLERLIREATGALTA